MDGSTEPDGGQDAGLSAPDSGGGEATVTTLVENVRHFVANGDRILYYGGLRTGFYLCPAAGDCDEPAAVTAERSARLGPLERIEATGSFGERFVLMGTYPPSDLAELFGAPASGSETEFRSLVRLPIAIGREERIVRAGRRMLVAEVRIPGSGGTYASRLSVSENWMASDEVTLRPLGETSAPYREQSLALSDDGDLVVWREYADETREVTVYVATVPIGLPELADEPVPGTLFLHGDFLIWLTREDSSSPLIVNACNIDELCRTVGRSDLSLALVGIDFESDRFYFGQWETESGRIASCGLEELVAGTCAPRPETGTSFELFGLRRLQVTEDSFLALNQFQRLVRTPRSGS